MATLYGANVVRDGLVLSLDAANPKSYPGSGTTWYDISGRNNHFTLFNSPIWFEDGYFRFTSSSQYARSTNTLNLSGLSAITVECAFRVDSINDNKMIFEHTINWNNQSGAFGAYTNSNGGNDSPPTTNNDLHMNSAVGRLDSGPIGDITQFGISQWTYVSGSGITHYHNDVQPTRVSASSGSGTFSNDFTYIATRGGTSFYDGNLYLAYLKIYDKALTEAEIKQNFNATRGRFGI